MSVLKCKSCGASLEIADDRQYIKCSYCGAVNVNEYFDVDADILQEALPTTESLLERAFMFLEDGEYSRADQYFERVLDIEPKCAEAYVGKLMAEMFCRTKEDLADLDDRFDDNDNYHKAMRFGDTELKAELQGYTDVIIERIELNRLEGIYNKASVKMKAVDSSEPLVAANLYQDAAVLFESIVDYKDSAEKLQECIKKKEECLKEAENRLKKHKRIMKPIGFVFICILIASMIFTWHGATSGYIFTEKFGGKTFSGYILRTDNTEKPVFTYDEKGEVYGDDGTRIYVVMSFDKNYSEVHSRTVIEDIDSQRDDVLERGEYYYDVNISISGKTTIVFGNREYTVTFTDEHEPVSLELDGFYFTEDAYINICEW